MFDRLDWYLRQSPWRNDAITQAQRDMLHDLGMSARPATKGEAADLISRHVAPDDEDLSFLHDYGVDSRNLSQFEAMNEIAKIIVDEKLRAEWRERQPLRKKDLCAGDRVLLLNDDNSRWLAELTSASSNMLKVRPVRQDGTLGNRVEVHLSALLAREGGQLVKHSGNLIAGDLIYTKDHRSGLQYGKVVRGSKYPSMTCIRWFETKGHWTKAPTPLDAWTSVEYLGHDTDPMAVQAYFARIEKDRQYWTASGGRSAFVRDPQEPGSYYWRQKSRVWTGYHSESVEFSSPCWSKFERSSAPKRSLFSMLADLIWRR